MMLDNLSKSSDIHARPG